MTMTTADMERYMRRLEARVARLERAITLVGREIAMRCPECGAGVGEVCRTPSDVRCGRAHKARVAAWIAHAG